MAVRKPLIVIPVVLAVLIGVLIWRVRATSGSDAPPGGSGTTEGVESIIAARTAGRITAVLAREGDALVAGQPVALIDCAEPDAALLLAQARVLSAEAQVDVVSAQGGGASDAVSVAAAQASAARQQAATLGVERAQAERDYKRTRDLAAQGVATTAQLEAAESRLRGLEKQLQAQSASTEAARLGTRVSSANVKVNAASLEAARAAVAAARAEVVRAQIAVSECTLRAPAAGRVTARLVEPGAVVGPGTRVLTTVALDPITVTFFLPNGELGRARLGGAAEVRVDAYPDRVFHGAVTRIAEEAEFTPRNVQTRDDRERLVFAVEVQLANRDGALRAGMPAEVALVAPAQVARE